jgi:hypothetical protein
VRPRCKRGGARFRAVQFCDGVRHCGVIIIK